MQLVAFRRTPELMTWFIRKWLKQHIWDGWPCSTYVPSWGRFPFHNARPAFSVKFGVKDIVKTAFGQSYLLFFILFFFFGLFSLFFFAEKNCIGNPVVLAMSA